MIPFCYTDPHLAYNLFSVPHSAPHSPEVSRSPHSASPQRCLLSARPSHPSGLRSSLPASPQRCPRSPQRSPLGFSSPPQLIPLSAPAPFSLSTAPLLPPRPPLAPLSAHAPSPPSPTAARARRIQTGSRTGPQELRSPSFPGRAAGRVGQGQRPGSTGLAAPGKT